MCSLTVNEKCAVPGEHREAFGSNKKYFNDIDYMRCQHRPELSFPDAESRLQRLQRAGTIISAAKHPPTQIKHPNPEDHRSPAANKFCAGGPI